MSDLAEKIEDLVAAANEARDKEYKNKILQEQILSELKELGIDSVAEAEKELKQIDKKIDDISNEIEGEYDEFVEKFSEQLGLD